MTYQEEKERIEFNLKARKLRLKLVIDEYNRQQWYAEELMSQNFKDEIRVKELNELINLEKPTLANHNRLLKALGFLFFILPSFVFAQDTIHVNEVRICNTLTNKSGRITKKFFRNMKVRSGYIVNKGNGVYEINGKLMKAGDFDSLIAKK